MNNGYISSTKVVKGFTESALAKSEKNDCVVMAIATATDMDYDSSHQFVKKTFKRQDRKGVYMFTGIMNMFATHNEQINGKSLEIVSEVQNTMLYHVNVKGQKVLRQTTTGSFVKRYPEGTYIVVVKGHTFTIKDGIVIGNPLDGKRMKKHVFNAWRVV